MSGDTITLSSLDRKESGAWNACYEQLKDSEATIISFLSKNWNQVLNDHSLTKSIIARMVNRFRIECEKAEYLGRKNLGVFSSDYFEDVVGFYFRTYLKSTKIPNVEVKINERFESLGKRPDILIKKNDETRAILELQFQMGWNRDDFTRYMNERLNTYGKLKNATFLIIFTIENYKKKEEEVKAELKPWRDRVVILSRAHPHPKSLERFKLGLSKQQVEDISEALRNDSIEPVFERIKKLL